MALNYIKFNNLFVINFIKFVHYMCILISDGTKNKYALKFIEVMKILQVK